MDRVENLAPGCCINAGLAEIDAAWACKKTNRPRPVTGFPLRFGINRKFNL
jgi:hypothetical protein